jgi:hypothetical protein
MLDLPDGWSPIRQVYNFDHVLDHSLIAHRVSFDRAKSKDCQLVYRGVPSIRLPNTDCILSRFFALRPCCGAHV